jgi:Xaa-Pro aminopeptidase
VHGKSPVDYPRAVKDALEIAQIRKSMQIVEKVFMQVKKQLKKKTWTELELAKFIRLAGHHLGAEDVSFPPIVASGRNAAIPHHHPSNKKLKPSESIIIDFGFKYKGYCSDFTRTVFLKRVPLRLERIYNQVEKAYLKSLESAKIRLRASRLYQTAAKILAEKRLEKYFIHNLGHGTGLEIHELPNLSPESKDILKEGMVFSIEPGVYIPRIGGVRVEDLVYLKNQKAEKFIRQSTCLKENIL